MLETIVLLLTLVSFGDVIFINFVATNSRYSIVDDFSAGGDVHSTRSFRFNYRFFV
ncbi:hypothetical protein AB6F55_06780 [Providencia hangzhouensis]